MAYAYPGISNSWRRGWSKRKLWGLWYRHTPLGRRTPLSKWVVPEPLRHKLSQKAQQHMRDRGL